MAISQWDYQRDWWDTAVRVRLLQSEVTDLFLPHQGGNSEVIQEFSRGEGVSPPKFGNRGLRLRQQRGLGLYFNKGDDKMNGSLMSRNCIIIRNLNCFLFREIWVDRAPPTVFRFQETFSRRRTRSWIMTPFLIQATLRRLPPRLLRGIILSRPREHPVLGLPQLQPRK